MDAGTFGGVRARAARSLRVTCMCGSSPRDKARRGFAPGGDALPHDGRAV